MKIRHLRRKTRARRTFEVIRPGSRNTAMKAVSRAGHASSLSISDFDTAYARRLRRYMPWASIGAHATHRVINTSTLLTDKPSRFSPVGSRQRPPGGPKLLKCHLWRAVVSVYISSRGRSRQFECYSIDRSYHPGTDVICLDGRSMPPPDLRPAA